jgi:beta-glucosidase
MNKIKSVAVIGDNAIRKHSQGGGSTEIKARYEITPLEGLKKKLAGKVAINFSQGYSAMRSDQQSGAPLDTVDMKLIREAVEVAKKSEYVLVFGGLNHNSNVECEGSDRPNMQLPYGQDLLISEVVKANPNTIVILLCGSPVEFGDWLDRIPGLIQDSYLGMEGGTALAEVLSGDVNPSGKLPYTFPKKLSDSPAHKLGEYPGKDNTVHYNEGLYVGYRYYDSKLVEPLFPFGYGLSYTQFEYSNLVIPKELTSNQNEFVVSFEIKNTGTRPGKEISQVYIHQDKSSLERPYKELKGFGKILLKPGETKKIEIKLNKRALQYYDPKVKKWVEEPGRFKILVGGSSKDIRLSGEVTLVR